MVAGVSSENGASAASRVAEEKSREVGLAPIPRRPAVAHSALGKTKRLRSATPTIAHVSWTMGGKAWGMGGGFPLNDTKRNWSTILQ